LVPLLLSVALGATASPTYGALDFPITGNAQCRRLFVTGMLHVMEANRPRDALAAYDATLLRYPNLSRALLGSARAARRAGDPVTARERYATQAAQWKAADPDLPELEEVRAGARAQRTSQR
jgi:hypothetical protein